MRLLPGLALLLVAASAFAGCVGDEETVGPAADIPEEAAEAVVTQRTGSVQGQILTVDLEPVAGEAVGLLREADAALTMTTTTDVQGRFTFNGVEPGGYRVHMAAPCCKEAMEPVAVQAGMVAEVSVLVDRVVSVLAYVDEKEWTGFLSCGIGTVNACYTDAQNYKEIYPLLSAGLQTVVIGMAWDATGLSTDLSLTMDRWENPEYHYDYASVTGPSPIRATVDDSTIDRDGAKFSTILDELKIRFIVNAPTTQFVYQQPFTLYWNEYYHEPAPEDADPIPDG